MRELIESHGVAYKNSPRYYTKCPLCAKDRRKSGTRSLSVSTTQGVLALKCLHSESCDYWKGKFMKIADNKTEISTEEIKQNYIFIPSDMPIPMPVDAVKYKYCDTTGNILFYVIRTKDKGFYPVSLTDSGELISKKPNFKTLYRAELLHEDNRPVVIVEGEKTADAAARIFSNADVVTWIGGASNVDNQPWEILKGREVILWPDNDVPGIAAMNKIAKLIDSARISIIDTSELEPKIDLADNIPLDKISELYKKRNHIKIEILPNVLSISSLTNTLNNFNDRLNFGFTNMDRHIRLPRSGLIIIEGRSGHGKSVFMINSAIKMLRNTDRKVVFVSYEVPEATVALRFIMGMEGVQKSPISYENEKLYIQEIQSGQLNTYSEFSGYLNNRLFITEENLTLKQLSKVLDTERLHSAIIYLDYLQLIPVGNKDSARYLAIKDIADTLREIANKRNQIIITGSQLTNGETPYQDMAREGRDITNASEITLKVWNKDMASATEDMKKVKKNKEEHLEHYYNNCLGNFAVSVKKSRVGAVGMCFGFNLSFGSLLTEAEVNHKEF